MPKAEKAEKVEKVKAPKAPKEKKEKKEKTARAPSAYNEFMKDEIAKVKKDQPELSHKEAFKVAAANWKAAKENPKNSSS